MEAEECHRHSGTHFLHTVTAAQLRSILCCHIWLGRPLAGRDVHHEAGAMGRHPIGQSIVNDVVGSGEVVNIAHAATDPRAV